MLAVHAQLAAFVRDRRKANRMTQRQLAELAGVGTRFVSELERAKPTLRLQTVNAVLAVFGKQLGIVDVNREEDDDA
jgi:y4mF family transcriptional regulator